MISTPRTPRAVSLETHPFTPSRLDGALFWGGAVLVDFESVWFKSYCKAVLDDEPDTARVNITAALSTINTRLAAPDLTDEEREAIEAAQRYLLLIRNADLPKAS